MSEMTRYEFELVSQVIEKAWARDEKAVANLIERIGATIAKTHLPTHKHNG